LWLLLLLLLLLLHDNNFDFLLIRRSVLYRML